MVWLGPLQRVILMPSTPSKINYATIPASETVEQLRNYTNIAISNIVAELNMQELLLRSGWHWIQRV